VLPTAQQQTAVPPDELLHSGNATVIVERIAQVRNGSGTAARDALREACEHVNAKLVGRASAFVYEEAFGVRDRLHILVHLASFEDYPALPLLGNQLRGGWDELFVAGSVHDVVMQPHRWGMHGSLTEQMAADPTVSPLGDSGTFVVTPAQAQTAVPPEKILHTANSGVVMRRTADFNYEFRNEARVFARTIAETVNLNAAGIATVFLYEEDFGRMDRVHWYIHMRSWADYYVLMGLDARTDPDAPRASYIQDWISMDKGGGSWERMLIQGSVRDVGLTPAYRPV